MLKDEQLQTALYFSKRVQKNILVSMRFYSVQSRVNILSNILGWVLETDHRAKLFKLARQRKKICSWKPNVPEPVECCLRALDLAEVQKNVAIGTSPSRLSSKLRHLKLV